MIFFGLDVGSSGCKCVAFSEDGIQLASRYSEYPSAAGQSDMDPYTMFEAICSVIAGCAADNTVTPGEVAAITVTSFGESFVPVDKNGKELADIVMYTDARGVAETAELISKVGDDNIRRITCNLPDSMYSLPKIMWTLRNRPQVADKVWKFLLIADYAAFKLSGEAKINYSLACRAMALDLANRCWSPEMLSGAGIISDMLSEPVPDGTIVGNLLPDIAEKLGLHTGVKVLVGSHDQISAAIGSGVLNAGQAVDGTGTVECITPVFEGIRNSREFTDCNFSCLPHPHKNLYVTYAFNFSGGALLKWYRDCLAAHLKPEAEKLGVSVFRMLDDTCPVEPTQVFVIPHFMGAGGTPDMVKTATGTISGLTMKTALPDIYRGALEGLTFEMKYNLEKLAECGIKVDRLCATGGGARSPIWLRIKSDILGLPIVRVKSDEAGACACAMHGAVAMGIYSDLAEAAAKFVSYTDTYEPETTYKALYDDKYARFREARRNMLELYK